MGCYMSTPDDRVYITEGKGKNFRYTTASCQGWRREQEDAEACIPYFDDDASLFVLCDGHGGAEVARYTVEHYPAFLKNHKFYKSHEYEQALRDSFKEFDALLRTNEVLDELNKLAFDEKSKKSEKNGDEMDVKDEPSTSDGPSSSSAAGSSKAGPSGSGPSNSKPSTVAEDVDTETLRREAQVPIEELIDKYSGPPPNKSRAQTIRQASLNLGGSPVIRTAQDEEDGSDQEDDKPKPSSSTSTSLSTSAPPDFREILKKAMAQYFDDADEDDDDSEDDSEFEGSDSDDDDGESDDDDDKGEDEEDDDDDEEDDEEDDEDGDDERDDEATANDEENKPMKRKRFKKRRRSKGTSQNDSSSENDQEDDDNDNDDDDDDDDDDEDEDDSDEDEEVEGKEWDSDEEAEKDEDWDTYTPDECFPRYASLHNNLKAATRVHRPGIDSGCTVVVALVKDKKLYVASSGDSRCIVIMRDGQCKPMSIDHKPEDYLEQKRIMLAGGRVTEGRVNGGLNLSRAFGDFFYKEESLPAEQQMITPCPDVRITDVDPEKVEYIFLACDGIWNSMKNQQVTKFIRKLAPTVNNNLVEICLGLFKNCIAPGTDGDGTGCDNMTCILARYNSSGDEQEQSDLNKTSANDSTTTSEAKDGTSSTATTTKSETEPVATTETRDTTPTTTTATTTTAGTVAGKRSAEDDANDEFNNDTRKRICLRLLGPVP